MRGRVSAVPHVRRYLLGQSLSILGDTALWIALGIWVKELTGSSADAGLSFFFLAAPSVAAPLWGTLVDRLRRRRVLIVGNLATAGATLCLLGVGGRHQVWLIWSVLAAYGVSSSVLGAAQRGYLRTMLPDELLGDAQAWLSTVREGLRLVAPFLGAGLFVLAGAHAVALIDASTFLVAAATVASIPLAEPDPGARTGSWGTEVMAGITHIRRTVVIRQNVLALALTLGVVGFAETAVFSVVTVGLHQPTPMVAGFNVLMGVGALVGGPTVAAAMRRLGEGRVAAIGITTMGVGCAGLVPASMATVVAGAVVFGFGLPWCVAATNTLCQKATPDHLQGRVSAGSDLLVGLPQTVSIALGAALVAVVGYQWLCVAMAVVTVGAGVWLVTRPEQRPAAARTPGPVGVLAPR